jgi:arylsulfatase A-like enzyme
MPPACRAVLAGLLACSAAAGQSPGENVLLVVADDLGVDAVRAYAEGSNPPPTPHIDALAARGVLFRNAWSNPSCSPTRACLHTGRYSLRTHGPGSTPPASPPCATTDSS